MSVDSGRRDLEMNARHFAWLWAAVFSGIVVWAVVLWGGALPGGRQHAEEAMEAVLEASPVWIRAAGQLSLILFRLGERDALRVLGERVFAATLPVDAEAPESFTPDLSLLDEMMASLRIGAAVPFMNVGCACPTIRECFL